MCSLWCTFLAYIVANINIKYIHNSANVYFEMTFSSVFWSSLVKLPYVLIALRYATTNKRLNVANKQVDFQVLLKDTNKDKVEELLVRRYRVIVLLLT